VSGLVWEKHGLVFSPRGDRPWQRSHAQLPVAQPLGGDRFRVYFAGRDEHHRSHVGAVELSLGGEVTVSEPTAEPLLAPGPLGHFDDHGVYPSSLVAHEGALFLYYIGWNPGPRPPLFYSSIGLAVSEDDGATFRRYSVAPIMARSEHDPCLVTAPCVLREGSEWRMWYVSGVRWEERDGELRSFYHVKYATSDDGVHWERDGTIAIDLAPGQTNVGRPCVVHDGARWRMWYAASSGAGYRPGYAESPDGVRWERRKEEAGIAPSPEGWDSQAIAYPWVFRTAQGWAMLYNGNGFGRDGFGLARATLSR
jgi:predicted GH43/DUF377 family glycosyl hydrolase